MTSVSPRFGVSKHLHCVLPQGLKSPFPLRMGLFYNLWALCKSLLCWCPYFVFTPFLSTDWAYYGRYEFVLRMATDTSLYSRAKAMVIGAAGLLLLRSSAESWHVAVFPPSAVSDCRVPFKKGAIPTTGGPDPSGLELRGAGAELQPKDR